jgi:hypothetical protein
MWRRGGEGEVEREEEKDKRKRKRKRKRKKRRKTDTDRDETGRGSKDSKKWKVDNYVQGDDERPQRKRGIFTDGKGGGMKTKRKHGDRKRDRQGDGRDGGERKRRGQKSKLLFQSWVGGKGQREL